MSAEAGSYIGLELAGTGPEIRSDTHRLSQGSEILQNTSPDLPRTLQSGSTDITAAQGYMDHSISTPRIRSLSEPTTTSNSARLLSSDQLLMQVKSSPNISDGVIVKDFSHETPSAEGDISFVALPLAETGNEVPSDTHLSERCEIMQKTTPDLPPTVQSRSTDLTAAHRYMDDSISTRRIRSLTEPSTTYKLARLLSSDQLLRQVKSSPHLWDGDTFKDDAEETVSAEAKGPYNGLDLAETGHEIPSYTQLLSQGSEILKNTSPDLPPTVQSGSTELTAAHPHMEHPISTRRIRSLSEPTITHKSARSLTSNQLLRQVKSSPYILDGDILKDSSHKTLSEERKASFIGLDLSETGHEGPSDTHLSEGSEIPPKTTADQPPTVKVVLEDIEMNVLPHPPLQSSSSSSCRSEPSEEPIGKSKSCQFKASHVKADLDVTQTELSSNKTLSDEEGEVSFVGLDLAERGHEDPSDTHLSEGSEIPQKTTPDLPPRDQVVLEDMEMDLFPVPPLQSSSSPSCSSEPSEEPIVKSTSVQLKAFHVKVGS